jgi:hypothetical protein
VARGWESKSVESQVDEAERERGPQQDSLSDAERARRERRQTLELTRARLRADLTLSTVPAHRRMLEQALDAIERQIAAL